MSDPWPQWKRSLVMSNIRGKGNLSTETKLIILLRAAKITGWRRHLSLPGTPDFAFSLSKVAVFTDGDFWHGRATKHPPHTNTTFWRQKIDANKKRDKRINRKLRALGWAVLRIWEGDLRRKPDMCISRIAKKLESRIGSIPSQHRRKQKRFRSTEVKSAAN